jgi:hypothetical protein
LLLLLLLLLFIIIIVIIIIIIIIYYYYYLLLLLLLLLEPALIHQAAQPINSICWPMQNKNYFAIAMETKIEVIRMNNSV